MPQSKKLSCVIWGASGHARVVLDIIRSEARLVPVACLVDVFGQEVPHDVDGLRVLIGTDVLHQAHDLGARAVIIGFGDCPARQHAAGRAQAAGFLLERGLHPSAQVLGGASLGVGTVVCAAAVVGVGAKVGANVIINTGATVDHECEIEDGVHIGPGAHLAGHVHVANGAWIGIGASIRDHCRIGAGAVIGAGATVIRDVPPNTIVVGTPAHPINSKGPRHGR